MSFSVELCVFGHIHGDGAHMAPQGDFKRRRMPFGGM